jgi:hypothetical protein
VSQSNHKKKNIFIYTTIGLISSLSLIACSGEKSEVSQQDDKAKTEQSSNNNPPADTNSGNNTNASDSGSTENSITKDWPKYNAYDGSYTVSFPQKPNEKKDNLETAVGKVYFVEAAYSDNKNYYSTSHTTYPVDPKKYDPEAGLNGSRDGISKSISMDIVREEKITIGGFPAREVEMKGKNGALLAHLILDPNGPTLYQVFVVSGDGNVNTPENKAFLDSFNLQRK